MSTLPPEGGDGEEKKKKTFDVAHTPNPCVKINACICPVSGVRERQETWQTKKEQKQTKQWG